MKIIPTDMREIYPIILMVIATAWSNPPAGAAETPTFCQQLERLGAKGRSTMWMTNVQAQVISTERGCLVMRRGTVEFACYLPKAWEGRLGLGDAIRYDVKDLECRIHEVIKRKATP